MVNGWGRAGLPGMIGAAGTGSISPNGVGTEKGRFGGLSKKRGGQGLVGTGSYGFIISQPVRRLQLS